MQVNLSNGTRYTAELVVYRDYIESNGKWRLFWQNTEDPGCGIQEQSTVMGDPWYPTMGTAIRAGVRKYGITATRAKGFAGDIR